MVAGEVLERVKTSPLPFPIYTCAGATDQSTQADFVDEDISGAIYDL